MLESKSAKKPPTTGNLLTENTREGAEGSARIVSAHFWVMFCVCRHTQEDESNMPPFLSHIFFSSGLHSHSQVSELMCIFGGQAISGHAQEHFFSVGNPIEPSPIPVSEPAPSSNGGAAGAPLGPMSGKIGEFIILHSFFGSSQPPMHASWVVVGSALQESSFGWSTRSHPAQ